MAVPLFRIIEVETRNDCNRRCWHCIHGQSPPSESREMPMDLIAKIVEDLRALRYSGKLNWFSANEPLLDERMEAILRLTRARVPWCRPRLFTNGDLLTQERLEGLFAAGLWQLRVSVYSDATYQRVNRLRCDGLNVKIVPFYRKASEGLRNRAGAIPGLTPAAQFANWTCPQPATAMVVRHDGVIKLCAEDLTGRTFGATLNCCDRSIGGLWHSEELDHYRAFLAEGRRAELLTCRDCSFHGHIAGVHCRPVTTG